MNPVVLLNSTSKLRIKGLDLPKPVKILVLSDAHLSIDDERGLPYQDNSKRMAGAYKQGLEQFTKIIDSLQPGQYDQLLMLGDMVSFPSAKGVETVLENVQKTQISFAYTAGNHDWHFEGLPGTEIDLRREWCAKRLAPLYQGRNPLCYSIETGGVNLVMMDTSACEILPEQLDFWREQVKKNLPTLLFGHIPLYIPGRSIGFSVGHPDWNASTDVNWKIERRLQWPESGHSQVTFDFHREVFTAPNLLGIITGHIHDPSMDFYQGKFQFSLTSTASGGYLQLTLE